MQTTALLIVLVLVSPVALIHHHKSPSCNVCVVNYNTGDKLIVPIMENVTDLRNPCLNYHCSANFTVISANKTCTNIDKCSDGKAPYYIHGVCCAQCRLLESMLQLSGNSQERLKNDSWSPWTDWTTCSRECDGGRQSRSRECITEGKILINCAGEKMQIRECNTHHCPIDGGWTEWTNWTDCTVTCDNGTQTKTRTCTNPTPAFGGKVCEGEIQEIRSCFPRHCPVDCKWKEWSEWSECSVECGGGNQSRIRDMQVEKYGGHACQGSPLEVISCNTHFCPIDGDWTVWSEWSLCSTTCGNGTREHSRSCTNPSPQHGGQDCPGVSTQVQECFLRHCPVDCQWEEFSIWSSCSVSCDGGVQSRERNYMAAMHGGDRCDGDRREIKDCNTQPCPDPCSDNGHPCFNNDVTCKKYNDTEFNCGPCPRGMRGDGRGPQGCLPVDECSEVTPCFPGTECRDLVEGYQCSPCPPGFTGEGLRGYELRDAQVLRQVCLDVDECKVIANGGCHLLRECENTQGSYVCGPCAPGYVDDGPMGCKFSDPCSAGIHDCQKKEYCNNYAVGEYHCFCPAPLLGNGKECSADTDLDGVADVKLTVGCDGPIKPCPVDNCPLIPNSGQEDNDNDGIGNPCDDDADNDGIMNNEDNCVYTYNPSQSDSDYDGHGNLCDNCPIQSNTEQLDHDWDGWGDKCDSDRDGDGVWNTDDNCPLYSNSYQVDSDSDGWGDACDNCIFIKNREQEDDDQDGIGDACDNNIDRDRDGIQDDHDNCLKLSNSDQLDSDEDGLGDPCDDDDDNDSIVDSEDNCPKLHNTRQLDINGNGVGDVCESDSDGDGVLDSLDSDGDKTVDFIDAFPHNKHIDRTNFNSIKNVILTRAAPGERSLVVPTWSTLANGTEVHQKKNSAPGLLIGHDSFSNYKYSGSLMVNTKYDDDYIGFVFNYQSNQRFILVSWKQKSQSYWQSPNAHAEAGLQIQVVKSRTGPSRQLMDAIWRSGDTRNQVDMIYHDPLNRGWEDKKPYFWDLEYSSNLACMRLIVKEIDATVFLDTGCLCDNNIKGGHVGLYVFSQEDVIFSNLKYQSLKDTEEQSLKTECKV